MRKKQTKKKNSFGLGSKISQLSKKNCPLAKKNDEELNYKNIKLLKKYISDSAKILPTRITNVSHNLVCFSTPLFIHSSKGTL